ncbi:hypothetical protein [Novosphingobium colocasiae]|uniref:Uncharacterized protein n=1 Tax=Novosphingobium colocasiae TaxID=1256513 RepID=A0A918PHJ1_9SPHN|nr:hypothetical protein [Novosphingobium colocasiae]GGZ07044.1 hypothetical protein GCM10011614_22320 [Novosphingobium colocasiae]
MGIFTVSDARHHRLQSFRRNTWKAIALCAALRLADTAFGFGLVEPTQTLAAQDIPVCTLEQDFKL